MISFFILLSVLASIDANCSPSITTVSGSEAPSGQICSGQLILNEEFNYFNPNLWKHDRTLSGGGVS